jgi:predicted alpha-1,2-mannosidase
MIRLSPDNQDAGPDAGYEYTINSIAGFSHLHSWSMSGILTMPATGPLMTEPGSEKHPERGYRSLYRHETENASPGYYSVFLDDYGILAELTTTIRTGFQRYTFPLADTARILLDMHFPSEYGTENLSTVMVRVNDSEIRGYSRQQGMGKTSFHEYTFYFVMRFSKPFRSFNGWVDEEVRRDADSIVSKYGNRDIGAFVEFATAEGEIIMMQTGLSLVSADQARLNLDTELGPYEWNFNAVRENARTIWDGLLGKIKIEGGTEREMKMFYTSLYRAYTALTTWNDVNGKYTDMYEKVQQLPDSTPAIFGFDGSLSDYRSLWQLWALVTPAVTSQIVRSMMETYDRGGWLPNSAEGIEYAGLTEPVHPVLFITGAYQKGIRDYDVDKAYAAVRRYQTEQGRLHEGGGFAGKKNLASYIRLGYVPEEEGPVFLTLDNACDDRSVAQMALALGRTNDYRDFTRRAFNYRNIFDTVTGCVLGRHADGTWAQEAVLSSGSDRPAVKGANEENWQSINVPHDPQGLISLMGKGEFGNRLEKIFCPVQKGTGSTQQLNIFPGLPGDSPVRDAAWLFNYWGTPWLTQRRVREILENDALLPAEGWPWAADPGKTGAWYVMSAIGLHQMDGGTAVKPVYELGSPLFEKIILHLDSGYYPGKTFVICARQASEKNRFIRAARLNGNPLEKPWFYHEDLVKGGTLELEMGPVPDEKWGSDPAETPPSMSSLLSQEEIREILAFDRNAAELEEWNRAVKAYYYHRKEQFESLPNTPGEIIFLGNSITDQAEWHEMFGSLNVKNRGIGGDDTDGILDRLQEVTESMPAKIFIMIGTNDLAYGKSIDHVVINYRKILDTIAARTPETEIYIQSILPTNDAIHFTRKNTDIMEINRQLEGIAREKGLMYIDLYSAFVTPDNKLNPAYSIDGLHLNGAGYKLWVSLISEYVGE